MKQIYRLLALTLCALLAISPLCTALSEEGLPVAESSETVIDALPAEDAQESTPPVESVESEGAPEEGDPALDAPQTPPEQSGGTASGEPDAEGDPVPDEPDAEGDPVPSEPDAEGGSKPGDPPIEGDPAAGEPSVDGDLATGDAAAGGDLPDEQPEQDDDGDAVPAIDYARGADASPAFVMGYAELLGDCPAYEGPGADAQALYLLPRDGVVYATRRSGEGQPDRLEAAFDLEGACAFAWIDAAALRPMSPDEASAFAAYRAAQQGARFLYDAYELPLDALHAAPLSPAAPASLDDEVEPVAAAPQTPVKLVLPQTAFVLGAGEACEIGAGFEDGQPHAITYDSENPEIAAASSDGKILAIAAGETKITLRSEFDETAEIAVRVLGAPTKIALSAPRTNLGVDEEIDLAVALPEGTASKYLRFFSNNDSVAEVSPAGRVTARAQGAAVITAETFNGAQASVTIKVMAAPEEILLDASKLTLGIGQTVRLKATIRPAGCTGTYAYTAEPEGFVEVDGDGNVTALAEGTATVTASTYNGKSASCTIEVLPAPSEISFAETEITLGLGEQCPLPKVVMPEGTIASYSIASANANIVKYKPELGAIKGRIVGTTEIIVTTHGGVKGTLKVTVKKAPTSITLSAPRRLLGVRETVQVTPQMKAGEASRQITYTSNNTSVASVDASGKVTAKAPGTAKIIAMTYNGIGTALKFTVVAEPTGIQINGGKPLQLGEGQTGTLGVTMTPSTIPGACTFSLDSGAGVIELNEATGAVKALREGTATVTASTYNGKSASCTVQVLPAPDRISFAETEITLGLGEQCPLPKVVMPEGTIASYSIASANANIVKYKPELGAIKGRIVGTTEIIVTTHAGVKGTLKVTVKKAPTSITLSAPRRLLGVRETVQVTPQMKATAASRQITYSSNNTSVASVDASGKVTAKAPGTAKIIAMTYNGIGTALKFTVVAEPTGIQINGGKPLQLGEGQTGTLGVTMTPSTIQGAYEISLDSGEGVIELNKEMGAVKALRAGTATVTAKTYNGKSASCTVQVLPAPDRISFAESEITLGLGEQCPLPKVVMPAGTIASYSIASANANIVKYKPELGAIKGRIVGTTEIIVTTHAGVKGTLKVTVKKAPTAITLSAPRRSLGVRETVQVTPQMKAGEASRQITYTSNNTSVASVDASGKVTAKAPGTAKIIATTYNGKVAVLKFTVVAEPTGIQINGGKPLQLGEGQTSTLGVTMTPSTIPGAYEVSLDSGEGVIELNKETGAVKALHAGTATVTAKTYNGKSASCTVQVLPAPDRISFAEAEITLGLGEQCPLPKVVMPAGTMASYSIASANANIVKYKPELGAIKGRIVGATEIIVTTHTGVKGTLKVTVKEAPASITLSAPHKLLGVGETVQVTPQMKATAASRQITYSSNNESVASVDASGKVTAKVPGTAKIIAMTYNGIGTALKFTVVPRPEQVMLPATLEMGVGEVIPIPLTTLPAGSGGGHSFTIDDASVANIDADSGVFEAKAAGTTTVRVEFYNGLTAQCELTVKKAPTALYLTPSKAGRCIDEKQLALSWSFNDPGEGGGVSFQSSNTKVATVSAAGVVSFVKTGTVKITATSYNGHKAFCNLTIGEKPGKMTFAQSAYKVALEDCVQIPVAFDKGCESYSLTAVDPTVVEVVSGEYVRGLRTGRTTLNAVSHSGLKASCEVEVVGKPTGLQLDTSAVKLVAGTNSTYQLKATPLPDGVGTVRFATSDPKVAVVDPATGLITAAGKGECTITATTYNGFQAKCTVTVSLLLEGVIVGIDPGHQAVGDMAKEPCSPAGGSYKYRCAYSSYGVAGVQEHVIDLTVSLKLRDALEKLGATVYMTRTTADVNISNRERALLLNGKHVDMALRIHCNAASSSSANGLSIYYRQTCAYADWQVDSKQGSAYNLMANENRLGWAIANEFVDVTGCNWRGLHRTDTYTMNNWSTVPCLLVELGFMTNPTEGWLLVDSAYQTKMVQGLVRGICVYMGRPTPSEW